MADDNPFSGAFTPVTEEITAFDLPVTGHPARRAVRPLPAQRPQPARPRRPEPHHWILGDGMVHGVRLRDGRAEWYRNRWVRSRQVAAAWARSRTGRPVPPARLRGQHPRDRVQGPHAGHREAGRCRTSWPGSWTRGPCDFGGTLPAASPRTPSSTRSTGRTARRSPTTRRWEYVQHVVIGPDGQGQPGPSTSRCGRPDDARLRPHREVRGHLDLPVTFSMAAARGRRPPAVRVERGAPRAVGLMPRHGDGQ